MKCKKCGKEVKENWIYCNYCGCKIEKESEKIIEVYVKDLLNYKITINDEKYNFKSGKTIILRKELQNKEYEIIFQSLAGKRKKKIDFEKGSVWKIEIASINNINIRQVKESIKKEEFSYKDFITTKKFKNYMFLDEIHKYICIPYISIWENKPVMKYSKYYLFSDITGVELQKDGECISSYTKGGLGSAIVGDLLFGPIGAIVGASTGKRKTMHTNKTEYDIIIRLNDINEPCLQIKIKYDERIANEITSAIEIIFQQEKVKINENEEKTNEKNDVFEDVKKLKELLDLGIITNEEFENKKKELLKL